MRQLTKLAALWVGFYISKLPMRQLTATARPTCISMISKLPMRQLTIRTSHHISSGFSKLPMWQLTMLERKKKPTARALIHLFPTLTQIYSCFEID